MKRGFTAYKSEQPLQSIVLQEKGVHKKTG